MVVDKDLSKPNVTTNPVLFNDLRQLIGKFGIFVVNPSDRMKQDSPVLLYDGFCFLCTSSARLLVRIDKKAKIKFAPLQSDKGLALLQKYNFQEPKFDTLLLLHHGRLDQKTNAVFEVFKILGGGWRLLLVFKIVPLFIRDAVYDLISRNRYRWFGKRTGCAFVEADRML